MLMCALCDTYPIFDRALSGNDHSICKQRMEDDNKQRVSPDGQAAIGSESEDSLLSWSGSRGGLCIVALMCGLTLPAAPKAAEALGSPEGLKGIPFQLVKRGDEWEGLGKLERQQWRGGWAKVT